MLKERRSSPRRVINRVAQFYPVLGALPRSCTVTDLSDGGARLHSEHPIPDVFVLSVNVDGGELRRECRVAWRLGLELGVSFINRHRMAV